MVRQTVRALSAVALLAGLVVPASAATLSVPSGDHPTIQSALDAAAAGDTVVIAPGAYRESLTIGPGRAGLLLVGQGAVTITAPVPGQGRGLVVLSPDVTVRGLSLRQFGLGVISTAGTLADLGPDDRADGLTLDRIEVVNSRAAAVHLAGDGVTVSRSQLIGNTSGLFIEGEGTLLAAVQLRNGSGGLRLEGDRARVHGCRVTAVHEDSGLHVIGAAADIQRNRIESVDAMGIRVLGSGALLRRNDVRGVGSAGYFVLGDQARLLGNRGAAMPVGGRGMNVEGHGVQVRDNRIESVAGYGFYLRVTAGVVAGNRAERCGSGGQAGLTVLGDDNRIQGNRVADCDDTGLWISGSGNRVLANLARGNMDNGLLIDGPAGQDATAVNVLERNVSLANHGDGIESRDPLTALRANRALDNLQDLSSQTGLSMDDLGGNLFASGGFSSAPALN